MLKLCAAFVALCIASVAHAQTPCARAHAECDAQTATCRQNHHPVRNGHDPNAACNQMAQARCAAAASCDQQQQAELLQKRHQQRELRREQDSAAAYQAGLEAGRAADKPASAIPPADDPHPFWTGKDPSRPARAAPEEEEPWRPEMGEQPVPPASQPAPSQAAPRVLAAPLTAEEVDQAIAETRDNLHICLQENLGPEVPHLHVALAFVVDAQGHATDLQTQGLENLPAHAEISACFARVANLWHFRAPPASQSAQTALDF